MPYCSLEEAWGGSFNNENTDKPNIDIPFSNLDGDESEYMSINYNEPSISDNKIRDKVYSRDMNRLSSHSGPLNRYMSHNKSDKLNYTNNIDNDWYPKKELGLESPPSYLNLDTPINKYDSELKNKLLSKQITETDYNYNDILDEQYIKDNEKILNKRKKTQNIDNSIGNERNERNDYDEDDDDLSSIDSDSDKYIENTHNSNLNVSKKYVTSKKKSDLDNLLYKTFSENEDKDIYDVIIYISTGIFIIFILDIFTKLGKNRN